MTIKKMKLEIVVQDYDKEEYAIDFFNAIETLVDEELSPNEFGVTLYSWQVFAYKEHDKHGN